MFCLVFACLLVVLAKVLLQPNDRHAKYYIMIAGKNEMIQMCITHIPVTERHITSPHLMEATYSNQHIHVV